ncbi:hypothetical protein [Brevibacterium casei]|uniref:hypothetical protein n=1 Tax=Brevibacterium casei TaxID=33889 RepID=UPI00119CA218|nr:hypothetical protein [Brevibacterium casei]
MNEDIGPSGGGASGKPISSAGLDTVLPDRESFNDAALAMVRMATDGGARTDLEQAMKIFGISRNELDAEVNAGLHDI